MTDYIDAFGNNSIPVADAEYGSYALTGSATFNWPYNYAGDGYIVYKTMEIACANGNVITMPPANQVSTGETTLIRNVGAETLTINKSDSTSLATIAAGAAVMLYVTDNSTEAGTWGIITYGTGSSSADAVSLAGYGLMAQGTVLNAAYHNEVQAAGWTVNQYDRAKAFVYTGGTDSVVLPAAATAGDDFFILLRNAGTGTLTITPDGVEEIDSSVSIAFNPGESAILVCSGSAWYTVGYGRSIIYLFTQLVKDVSAGGTFTLTDAEAGNQLLTFTGNPASAVTVEVPAVVSIYYINSDISTAQTITVKTTGGTGAAITQGLRSIVFCDSVDVLAAQTATTSSIASLEDGSVTTPSLNFATDTDTGIYKVTNGFAGTVNGVNVWTADDNGFSVGYGYLKLPGATTPSQIVEGATVWDTDSDLLTVGTGSSRKTMCDTDTAQTLTNKTLTSPVLTIRAGTAPTTEGLVEWNTSTDKLLVGTGSATKTLVNNDDVIAIAQGGTGQTSQTAGFDSLAPTTTKGDVIVHNGTDNIRLAKGTDAYFLKANSATASGLEWVAGTATESVAGVLQIADLTETFAGTDDATIVTPLKLRQWGQGQYKAVQVASTKTVDYTDIGQYIYNTGSSGYTVTTPTSADITYPIGARIDFAQTGTGTITFAAGSGVTISGASGMVLRQYKAVTLVRISSTSWHLIGGATA